MKTTVVVVFLLVFLTIPACAASIFTLTGETPLSGQGFGNIVTILSLDNNSPDSSGIEVGAVAPTNASNLPALGSSFGTCSIHNGIDLCGDATNSSKVITVTDLASLSFTSDSTFGLVYNVNQQGSDLNTYLNSSPAFTVYFYDPNEVLLFSASYAGSNTAFPPVTQNGQGTAGWLFALSGDDFATNFSNIAYVGMSGTIANANDGPDDWSVVNAGGGGTVPGGGEVPEPLSMFLMGGGLLGVGIFGKFRRA